MKSALPRLLPTEIKINSITPAPPQEIKKLHQSLFSTEMKDTPPSMPHRG